MLLEIDPRSSGVAMRALRTTTRNDPPTANTPSQDESGSVRASLGRLLRLVADARSDNTHMEAAITQREKHESSDRVPPSRVLALSDHRHMSNLGSVLDAVDRAIASLSKDAASTGDVSLATNMLRAFVTALATQAVDECTSTKHNVCVWTAQSRKRLLLLEWILRRSPFAFRIVVDDALRGELESGKSSQLTYCLVLFELAQRWRRRRFGHGLLPVPGDWSVVLDPLVDAVKRGTVQTASGPKASTLGAAALDALVAVLCLTTDLKTQQQQARVLEGMEFALSTLTQWHQHSVRRQWLLMAVDQLALLVHWSGRCERFDMVAWHWNATAMWLCARSESVLIVKKRLTDAVARSVNEAHRLSSATHGDASVGLVQQHGAVAMLRRVCALFSLCTGDCADLLSSVAVKGKLLLALAAFLSAPTTRKLALAMMRRLLLGRSDAVPVLVLSRPEVEALVAVVQRHAVSNSRLDNEVAYMLAALCLRAGVTTLDVGIGESSVAEADFWLSITDHAVDLYQTIRTFDQATRTQWLRTTTRAVLRVMDQHTDKSVRTHAATLIPRLDLVVCMQFAVSTLLLHVDAITSGHVIAWIFACARSHEALTTELANVLVDTLCRGASVSGNSILDPRGLSDTSPPQSAEFDDAVLAKSRDGWCTRLDVTTQTTIVTVLIQKAFGSPRDSIFVTWLRELSLLGWFDATLARVLPIVTTHMTTQEKLTDELVEDDSPRASRAVEHLLFARLAPHLVLRVIPRESFLTLYRSSPVTLLTQDPHTPTTAVDCLVTLAHALWSHIVDPLEYKEVKMLSIELLTKLPVHEILPHVLDTLVAFVRSQGTPAALVKVLTKGGRSATDSGFVTAKLLMYYLNLIFTDDTTRVDDLDLMGRTTTVLLTVLSLPCPPNEAFSAATSPLVDLQMGTIECLSLLVAKSLMHPDETHDTATTGVRLIEDALVELMLGGLFDVRTPVVNDDPATHQRLLPGLNKWHTAVRDSCRSDKDLERISTTQVQICCCNVLLSALAKLDATGTLAFQHRILHARILPSMASLPPPVLAGSFQIAFSFFFKAGASLSSDDRSALELTRTSVAAVVQILQSSHVMDDGVYMNALKLLGALIGKVPWLWSRLASDGTTQQSIAAGLQTLRDARPTTSPATRQLAQSLLQAILSG